MTQIAIYSRLAVYFYFFYKLIADPKSVVSSLHAIVGKRLKISEAESTLIATLLFVIGLADLLPVLESNNVYFKSMPRARLIIFSMLALVSFLQVGDILNGDLVFLLSVFEIAMNSLIIAEGN